MTKVKIILYILKRGFLLGAFAIFLQHLRPFTINPEPNKQTWWIALLGFFLLFLMFVRWPNGKWQYGRWFTLAGWLATMILIASIQYPNGSGLSVNRSDIILVVLANMAIFGSLAWLFTKSNLLLRLGFLGLLLALRLSSNAEGWIALLWRASPVPWIFHFDYLKYLFIVIPGTIAGDLILSWMQRPVKNESYNFKHTWSVQRLCLIIVLMFTTCLLLLIGLQARWVWQTTLLSAVLCLASYFLFIKPQNDTEHLIKHFYNWGIYWLTLGLLLEPFEGGIKKDSSTLSYYFITTALAFLSLIIFTIFIDIFKQQKWLQLFIENGKNPMIAYVGFANLLWPILILTQVDTLIIEHTKTPMLGFLKGLFYTLTIAYIVWIFNRLQLFWKT